MQGRLRIAGLVMVCAAAAALFFVPAASAKKKKPLRISIADAPAATEGVDANLAFPVTLSRKAPRGAVLKWSLSGFVRPTQVDPPTGVTAIRKGSKAAVISIPIHNNNISDYGSDLAISVAKAPGSRWGRARVVQPIARGQIRDDEPLPRISVGDASIAYPVFQSGEVDVPVTIDHPSINPVLADFTTGAPGDTAGGADYDGVSGFVMIPAGQTRVTMPVTVLPFGGGPEPAEFFTAALASPSSAVLGDAAGIETITTDDETPCVPSPPGPPVNFNSTGIAYGVLCPSDTSDSYSYSVDTGKRATVTLIPMNTGDDPDLTATPAFVTDSDTAKDSGQVETLHAGAGLGSFSFTITVTHGDDHSPARAEGYVLTASQANFP